MKRSVVIGGLAAILFIGVAAAVENLQQLAGGNARQRRAGGEVAFDLVVDGGLRHIRGQQGDERSADNGIDRLGNLEAVLLCLLPARAAGIGQQPH